MAKHNMFQKNLSSNPSKLPVHPIWRGIGCVLIIALPFVSYIIASYLINNRENYQWLILPEDLIFNRLKDSYLAVKILYAGFITFILGFVLAAITFTTNRLLAPSRMGPYDVSLDEIKRQKK